MSGKTAPPNGTTVPGGTYDIEGRFRTCIQCTAIAGGIVTVGRTWPLRRLVAILHFPDRLRVLKDWFRVLQPGARLLYTDAGVGTGPISNEEVRMRGPSLFLMFVPPGMNETLLAQAGFRVVRCEDVTENQARLAERMHAANQRHRDERVQLRGQEGFDMGQSVYETVRRLGSEQRLSRMVYVAEKPDA